MTRAEREAAGWTLCWGIFDWTDRTWWCGGRLGWLAAPVTRWAMETPTKANDQASGSRDGVVARPFWRRKKPKPAPKCRHAFETHAVSYCDYAQHLPSLGLLWNVQQLLLKLDRKPVRIIVEET